MGGEVGSTNIGTQAAYSRPAKCKFERCRPRRVTFIRARMCIILRCTGRVVRVWVVGSNRGARGQVCGVCASVVVVVGERCRQEDI